MKHALASLTYLVYVPTLIHTVYIKNCVYRNSHISENKFLWVINLVVF